MKQRVVFIILFLVVCVFYVAWILYETHQLLLLDLGVVSSAIGSLSPSSDYSSDAIEFEGASEFLSILRKAYQKKIANPPSHCRRRHERSNATNEKVMKVEVFNRAIEIDWIGKDIPAVEPTWSSPDRGSCNFVGLAFPPTKGTLHAALHQTTYISSFQTVGQCKKSFKWESDAPTSCLGVKFGGTLGANTEQGCVEESVSGYNMVLWNEHNSNDDLLQCLKHYLEIDEVLRMVNITPQMEGMIANLTKMDYLSKWGYTHRDEGWSTLAFLHWAEKALRIEDSASGISGILQSAVANATISKETVRILQGLSSAVKNDKNPKLKKCVEDLLPPMIDKEKYSSEEERIWKETGAYLSASTMKDSPSSLLKKFPASLHGVLPPPPTAIYSVNALLGTVLNVDSEAYYPGCTAFWNSILQQGGHPKNAFKETNLEANRNDTIFAHLKRTPNMLRNEVIKTCAEDASKCPFPTYDLVIDVTQVYCGGFFHFTIESKCT